MSKNIIQKTYRYLIDNYEFFTKLQLLRVRKKYTYKVLNDNSDDSRPSIHFIHRYITNNTGDKACGYYQYFLDDFKDYKCILHDINGVHFSLIKSNDIVIIGGGGLLNASAEWNYNINKSASLADKAIIWSAGFNSKKGSNKKSKIKWELFNLVTVRDYLYGDYRYTPCATCVMPELGEKHNIKREIGVVAHKDVLSHLPVNFQDYEIITNNAPIEQFVEFIASSEVVFTNSYHAAYWSTLLQKKCILFAPRSEKYDYYKYPPVLYSGDLASDISKAKIYPDALSEARELTTQFLIDIKSLLKTQVSR